MLYLKNRKCCEGYIWDHNKEICESKYSLDIVNLHLNSKFLGEMRNHSSHYSLDLKLYPVECKPGYIGPSCSKKCPHPAYGDACQGICTCSEDECDSVTGCKPMSSGTRLGCIYFYIKISKWLLKK